MDRTTKINNIVEKRNAQQERIRKQRMTILSVQNALNRLKTQSDNMQKRLQADIVTSDALRQLKEKIGNTEQIVEQIISELRRLETRTGRGTINIGIVGIPKQGKSTFLQALTGLDEATIPTGTDYVTGACSYILNDTNVERGNAYAIVTPYNHTEFLLDVLTPFCEKFHLHLDSVDDLPYLELPDSSEMSVTDSQTLGRLEKLKADYPSYKGLLGQSSLRIEKDDIRRFVAQRDEMGNTEYSNWYAIKKAEIHCNFPHQDLGRIMICDTPGLGDFTPSAEQALMEKLSTDMDIIFFMQRLNTSNQTLSEADAAFYDVVQKSNRVFKVDEWAYMILNCNAGETPNDSHRKKLETEMRTRLGLQLLDAKNPSEVSETFDTIIDDIVVQIPKLDTKLQEHHEAHIKKLKEAIQEIITYAKSALPVYSATSAALDIDEKVDEVLDQLHTSIESYKEELSTKNISLAPAIAHIIETMRDNVPELSYRELDKAEPIKWIAQSRDKLRAAYISSFSGLDSSMEEMVTNAQNRLQEILCNVTGGRLAFVMDGSDNTNFWQALTEMLITDLGERAEALVRAINNVRSFKMQFRAFILPRLTRITTGLSNNPKHVKESFAPYKEGDTIEDCKHKLQTAWARALAKSEELFDEEEGDMKDVCSTPVHAIIALIDEFYLLWMKHGSQATATAIWRNFYKTHAPEIWPEIYKSDTSMLALSRKWNDAIKDFSNATLNTL